MRITDALLGEHGAIYPLLDFIENTAPGSSLAEMKDQTDFLRSTLMPHAALEDAVLRPAILEYLPRPLPTVTDHQAIENGLDQVLASVDRGQAAAILLDTIAKTREHFHKEEAIIFGIADRELTEDQQQKLGAEWAARRHVHLA